jgi:hypothetical protein
MLQIQRTGYTKLDQLWMQLLRMVEQKQEPQCAIYEMMVPYKGTRAGNLRQYIQDKPHKWGFNIFVRAGISGIFYDFLPYTRKGMLTDLSEEEIEFGIGGQVVIKLCQGVF